MSATITKINKAGLRDPQNPVSKIADRLMPYPEILADQFQPEKVILFGSYAYGNPN